MVKEGAVIIDVGNTPDENGKLKGDVDYDAVKEIAGAITPVAVWFINNYLLVLNKHFALQKKLMFRYHS